MRDKVLRDIQVNSQHEMLMSLISVIIAAYRFGFTEDAVRLEKQFWHLQDRIDRVKSETSTAK